MQYLVFCSHFKSWASPSYLRLFKIWNRSFILFLNMERKGKFQRSKRNPLFPSRYRYSAKKKNGFALVLFKTIWYEKRIGFYLCIWIVLWNVSSDWEGTNWLRSLIQNFNASKGFTEWKTIYLFPLDKYTLFMLRQLKNIYIYLTNNSFDFFRNKLHMKNV